MSLFNTPTNTYDAIEVESLTCTADTNQLNFGQINGVSILNVSSNTSRTININDTAADIDLVYCDAGSTNISDFSVLNFTGNLLGNVTGTQSNTVVATVGGKTSSEITTSVNLTSASTHLNTVSTLVKRDASGNFSATQITAGLIGNSSTSTLSSNTSNVSTKSASAVVASCNLTEGATSSNINSRLVLRDNRGSFVCTDIYADLIGTASSCTLAVNTSNVSTKTAAQVVTSVDLTNAATHLNSANAIVKRDASGNIIINYLDCSRIVSGIVDVIDISTTRVLLYLNLIPETSNNLNLGSTTVNFNKLYINSLYNGTIQVMDVSTTQITPRLNMIPSGTVNLGSDLNKYSQLFSTNISDTSSNLSLSSLINITPLTTTTYDLGSSLLKWNKLYTRLITDDATSLSLGQITSSLTFTNDASSSIGTLSKRVNEIYTKTIRIAADSDTVVPTLTFHDQDQGTAPGAIYSEILVRSSDNSFTDGTPNTLGTVCSRIRWYHGGPTTNLPDVNIGFWNYNASTIPDEFNENLQLRYDGVLITRHIYPYINNTYNLGVAGTRWKEIFCVNGTINISDRNQKTDIQTSILGLDFVNKLKPVSYKWKDYIQKSVDSNGNIKETAVTHQRTHYGLISQDIESTLNELNLSSNDFAGFTYDQDEIDNLDIPKIDGVFQKKTVTNYGLRYTEFIAPLIKAVQELSQQNQSMLLRIIELEKKTK